jgi:uncharacterized protein
MNVNAAPVPSPCVSICVMDAASGLCTGCHRTLDEIAVWSLLDDAEKLEIWAALKQRRLAARRAPEDARPSTP